MSRKDTKNIRKIQLHTADKNWLEEERKPSVQLESVIIQYYT
jgi:hypothetical protein